jgi:hypothetical protein
MKKVTFAEYQSAKNEILYGKEYKEYSTLDGNTIRKEYCTEDGDTFYEVSENGSTEFWSTKNAESRVYEEHTLDVQTEILGVECTQIARTAYVVKLANGTTIAIMENVEYNRALWAYKIDSQYFSKRESAISYLHRLIQEKLTGLRIINHKQKRVPEICEGACRHPNECNRALCSQCPIALKFFADRDNLKLVYVLG